MRRAGRGSPSASPSGQDAAAQQAAAGGAPSARRGAPALAGGGLRLPSAQVCALLVAVFVGFGVLLGHVARTPVGGELASARRTLKLVVPAAAASSATAAQSTGSTQPSTEPTGEPSSPPQAPEASPTPAPSSAAKAPSGKSGGGSRSGTPSQGSSEKPGSGSSSQGSSSEAAAAPAKQLPAIKHVFLIVLSDEPYASVFGPASPVRYLTGTLEREGELLTRFDAVAHEQLADEVALVSGQGPTSEIAANCPTYTAIQQTGTGADSQVLGSGCVYPHTVRTIAGQLGARGMKWKAYIQGIDEAGSQHPACAHPALGAADATAEQGASSGPYATFRNPFVYFDSVLETPECESDDVGLASLQSDLAEPSSTPNFAYIAPDRCDDGNPTPCTPGAPAGMAPTEAFLKQTVGEITASKAYKENGLLVITTDEAPSSGAFADSSSCCGQPLFPNDPVKNAAGSPGGGGEVGALLLSPYVKGATTGQEAANDFSLLATFEELFGVERLGYAGAANVKPLEPALFTAGKTGKG